MFPFRFLARTLAVGITCIGLLVPLTVSAAPATSLTQDTVVYKCLRDGYYPGNLLFSIYNGPLKRSFGLYCQDGQSSGVFHINDGHPIPLSQTGEFSRCVTRLISFGSHAVQSNGSIYWSWTTPFGIEVRGYTDSAASGHIRTVFTSGDVSNKWTACGY